MEKPVVLPISLKPSNLRPVAYRVLTKKYGLNIQSSALERLSGYVGRNFGSEWRGPMTGSFLEQVGRMWKDQNRGLFIDGEGVDQIIQEIGIKNSKRAGKAANDKTKPIGRTDTIDDTFNPVLAAFEVYNDGTQVEQDTQPMDEGEGEGAEEEDIDWKDFFRVIDLSRYRRFQYDTKRKHFELQTEPEDVSPKAVIFPTSRDIVKFHIIKFHLLKDKLLRNEHFQPSSFSSTNSITGSIHPKLETQQIVPIKNLLGRHGQRFTMFGLLTANAMGLWQLQDDSDAIVLELSQCIFPTNCFITPGNYVVCDGIYSNSGKFYVSSMVPPPPEDREASLDALGNIDFTGIYSKSGRIDAGIKRRLPLIERKYPNHKIIFLGGDVFLDDMKILEALKKFFKLLTEEIEESNSEILSIVFPGSFMDRPLDVTEFSSYSWKTSSGLYKSYFDSFAALLEKFPKLCQNAKFVLLPGDKDPWSSMVTKDANSVWPKFRIPSVFGSRLKRLVKDIEWASNPCKMNYLAHDITIVRDDLGSRLRRNDISYVSNERESEIEQDDHDLEIDKVTRPKCSPEQAESRKVVKTLLDQADLSPFTIQTRPILANYWPAISLLPLPDLLVLVDPSTPNFDLIYENCHVVNPGTFYKEGKISYIEYTPSTRKAQQKLCAI
ncbi:DEKNAAC104656 [Brettanomyces naardenensis]|uniref:DNA polymerase epsilon subunit B n=1 Tax=Brettanomyces naardenensis TaxID=13370 RepID=A0A448YRF1_BRENA|nr:DEKNAAC104656 [Brettanomyces naardenensis]